MSDDPEGFIRRTDVELAGIFHGQLPPDDRPMEQTCAVCRVSVNPQRRRWMAVWGKRYAVCGLCDSADNDGLLLRLWLKASPEGRRRFIVQTFGIDPATRRAAEIMLELIESTLDVDGLPSSVLVTRHRRVPVLMPRMSWHVLRERGQLR